jgi:pyruvate dehydrogenase E1 component beta subunit
VIFFEPKRRYWEKAEVDPTPPAAAAQRPVVRPGSTLTLVGYGPVLKTCLEAATAAAEDGTTWR